MKRSDEVSNSQSVLPNSATAVSLAFCDFTSEPVNQELRAVTNAENGHAELEYLFIHPGGIVEINRVRAASEDYPLGVHLAYFVYRRLIRFDFAVNLMLAHSARNELVVLSAEIDDQNFFVLHILFPY